MKRIAIGFLVALLVSLLLVGVAAAEWPPYYYAGWRDCNGGCIPPYNYGMYHDYGRWAASNYYNYNYTYNNYNYTYNNYNYDYDYDYNYNLNYNNYYYNGGCDGGYGCYIDP